MTSTNVQANDLLSIDWVQWLRSLSREDCVLILMQSWAIAEINRRKLYDNVLGDLAYTEDDQLESFYETCKAAGVNGAEIAAFMEHLLEDLAVLL